MYRRVVPAVAFSAILVVAATVWLTSESNQPAPPKSIALEQKPAAQAGNPTELGKRTDEITKFALNYSVSLQSLGADKWQLSVRNTHPTKPIVVFGWAPPTGLTITGITDTKGGNCKLSRGVIRCSVNLAPESCNTCEGGSVTIHFTGPGASFQPTFHHTAHGGYWISKAWLDAGYIDFPPSNYLQGSFADLPHCAKGQVTTKAEPCAKR